MVVILFQKVIASTLQHSLRVRGDEMPGMPWDTYGASSISCPFRKRRQCNLVLTLKVWQTFASFSRSFWMMSYGSQLMLGFHICIIYWLSHACAAFQVYSFTIYHNTHGSYLVTMTQTRKMLSICLSLDVLSFKGIKSETNVNHFWRKDTLIARFMGPTWDPSGADRTQVGPMSAPWTLQFG